MKDLDHREQISTMLEENMQRADLTVYEQAQGFQLMLDLGETIETIEKKTGFGHTTIQHRLNIAKLDSKVIREKEKDDSFQLSLKDYYELEKIKNIKTRNKVLKEATSSQDLVRRALQEVRAEKRAEHAKVWLEMLDARGITENPDARNDYGTKFETLKEIDLDEEPGKRLRIEGVADGDELYWCESWRGLKICRAKKKTKDVEKQLSPWEKEQKEKEKKRKQIRSEEYVQGTGFADRQLVAGGIQRLDHGDETFDGKGKVLGGNGKTAARSGSGVLVF